jgi:hypothetical protein
MAMSLIDAAYNIKGTDETPSGLLDWLESAKQSQSWNLRQDDRMKRFAAKGHDSAASKRTQLG